MILNHAPPDRDGGFPYGEIAVFPVFTGARTARMYGVPSAAGRPSRNDAKGHARLVDKRVEGADDCAKQWGTRTRRARANTAG